MAQQPWSQGQRDGSNPHENVNTNPNPWQGWRPNTARGNDNYEASIRSTRSSRYHPSREQYTTPEHPSQPSRHNVARTIFTPPEHPSSQPGTSPYEAQRDHVPPAPRRTAENTRPYTARDVFMPPGHLTRSGSSNSALRLRSDAKPKGEDRRRGLVDPHVVRDVIIGLSDGLTVPFALTAGLSTLGESKLVILGGVAELIAGAISMGVGGFLAAQSERDHARYLREQTRQRILREDLDALEREVHDVLGPVGVDEYLSRQIALELRNLEPKGSASEPERVSADTENAAAAGKEKSVNANADVGLTAFIMKFSEGVEEMSTLRLYISAFTIGMGYLIGGIIPLMPYFFEPHVKTALIISAVITGVTLLIFGVVKTHITGAKGGFRGYAWGAISTLLVGGAAAAAAYGITAALEKKTNAVTSCPSTMADSSS